MTYDEMRNLKVGDKIFYKAFNTELTVWDVTIEKELGNCWIQAETESHVSIEFGYLACGEFDVIKKKTYLVPLDVECCLDWHITASSEEKALEIARYMLKTVSDEYILNGCRLSNAVILEDDILEEE